MGDAQLAGRLHLALSKAQPELNTAIRRLRGGFVR